MSEAGGPRGAAREAPAPAPGAVVGEISMSLDGYVTGPDDRPGQGLGVGGEVLHYWVFGGPWSYGDSTDTPLHESTGADRQVLDQVFGGAGLDLHVAPVLLGAGRRLFAAVGRRVELAPLGAVQSPLSTHLRYRVVR